MHRELHRAMRRSVWAVIGGAVMVGGCASRVEQRSFATPEAAVEEMIAAVRPEVDRDRLKEVFGPEIEDGLLSGDIVSDRADVEDFLTRYDAGHRMVEVDERTRIVEVGPDQWPFAFPIVRTERGWEFDTPAGVEELRNRRVGANELDTIQTCLAIVDAQREYAMLDADGDGWRQYARQFRSDAGTRNGLYWPAAEGGPESPLGDLVARAADQGYGRGDRVYLGYRFRMLTEQGPGAPGGAFDYVVDGRMLGGFGVVAWPAEYGESGVMTFLTNQDGVVYQRDLGAGTDRAARRMRAFDPSGWSPVAEQDLVIQD